MEKLSDPFGSIIRHMTWEVDFSELTISLPTAIQILSHMYFLWEIHKM